jgi:hypothetical protein
MIKVIQADLTSVSERGLRNVIDGEVELCYVGFEFNIRGKLGTSFICSVCWHY